MNRMTRQHGMIHVEGLSDPRILKRASQLIRWITIAAVIVALVIAWHVASAETLHGRVVGITDGDRITVLDTSRQQHKIRLAGIDAPESRQAFGTRSRQNLSGLAFGKDVEVEWKKHDRYKRIVGKVLVDGHDVNLEQVRAGMAWWYRQYAKEQTSEDRQLYELAENEAKAARRGLWTDNEPVPPWDFRRAGK
jgi:endonuclease YncB( thermonuclease family)